MSWNYRVVRHSFFNTLLNKAETWLQIHEAYYDKDGTPTSISTDEATPMGDTVEELESALKLMLKGLKAPVLDYEGFDKPSDLVRELDGLVS